jgi:phosphonate transport system substrate-binding protein
MVTKDQGFTIFLPYMGNLPYETIVSKADDLSVLLSDSAEKIIDIVVPDGDRKYGQNEAIAGMEAGEVDLAFLSWQATLVADEAAGVIPGLNIVRFGSHFYRSQILTYASSGVSEINDLDGRSMCWVDPYSVSGYIVPSMMLLAESVDPDANSTFLGSHNDVIWELYDDNCDGGATYVDARDSNEFPSDVYDTVIPIAISPFIPNDGFAYRDEFSEDDRTQINNAIIAVVSTPEGADLMLSLIGSYDGFVESDFSLYQGLYELIYEAGLTPVEIWVEY